MMAKAKVTPIGQSTPVKITTETGNFATKQKNLKQCFESEDEDGGRFGGQEDTKAVPRKGKKIIYQKRPAATPKKRFICNECGKSFVQSFYIKIHKRTVHSGEKSYSCDKCEKSFGTSSNLGSHTILIHSEVRPFPCNQCEKSFKLEPHLKKHKVRCHVEKDPNYVTKIFDDRDSIYKFPCEDCGKCFTTKWSLILHERTHTGEKQFSCDHCEKSFAVRCNLQNHKRRHFEERPFPCNSCDETFKTSVNLYNHKWKTVKGVRNAKCM